jgi:putative RNA 2'-phosphotransferase
MDDRARTSLSKFLSLVLRHRPEIIAVELDQGGWIAIDELLAACCAHGRAITRAMLDEVVEKNTKRRFAISDDGLSIRASQGHSVEVELGCEAQVPPEFLFHGTVASRIPSIRARGLEKMKRHHVHLSPDVETARAVGGRKGRPVVLRVLAGKMHRDGHAFFLSANGVWLADRVLPEYLEPLGKDGRDGAPERMIDE